MRSEPSLVALSGGTGHGALYLAVILVPRVRAHFGSKRPREQARGFHCSTLVRRMESSGRIEDSMKSVSNWLLILPWLPWPNCLGVNRSFRCLALRQVLLCCTAAISSAGMQMRAALAACTLRIGIYRSLGWLITDRFFWLRDPIPTASPLGWVDQQRQFDALNRKSFHWEDWANMEIQKNQIDFSFSELRIWSGVPSRCRWVLSNSWGIHFLGPGIVTVPVKSQFGCQSHPKDVLSQRIPVKNPSSKIV